MPIHGLVWICELKPNHHFSDGTKKEPSATKRIYNKSTHSWEVDEQINRPQVTSKATKHWAFLGLKLGGWWEAGCNSPHICQSNAFFHHLQSLHLGIHSHANRRQKSMEVYRWCLMKSWAQEDVPKTLEMKLSCKYQWGSFFDHLDGRRITNKQRRTSR